MFKRSGEGQTIPVGIDGGVATTVFPKPVLGMTVTMGGRREVLYVDAAPGLYCLARSNKYHRALGQSGQYTTHVGETLRPVSYTHLTLPTNREV